MKKVTYLLILIMSSVSLLPAQIAIEWQQCYGSSGEDIPYSIARTDDGVCVAGICGSSDGTISINLTGHPSGVYTLRVTLDDGSSYSEKVVRKYKMRHPLDHDPGNVYLCGKTKEQQQTTILKPFMP